MKRIYFLAPDLQLVRRIADEIEARVTQHLPNVQLEVTEPTIPAFP